MFIFAFGLYFYVVVVEDDQHINIVGHFRFFFEEELKFDVTAVIGDL